MVDEEIRARRLRGLERLGQLYFDRYLSEPTIILSEVRHNWWASLKFCFDRSFERGRRGALSERYRKHTTKTLAVAFGLESALPAIEGLRSRVAEFNIDTVENHIQTLSTKAACDCASLTQDRPETLLERLCPHFGSHEPHFLKHNADIPLNLKTDLRMVAGFLRMAATINGSPDITIFGALEKKMRERGLDAAWEVLAGIPGVKQKISRLIVRDVYLLTRDSDHDSISPVDDDWQYGFPVDTWVEQMADRLLDVKQRTKESYDRFYSRIRDEFIIAARGLNLNPCLIAAGLWYLGVCPSNPFLPVRATGYHATNEHNRLWHRPKALILGYSDRLLGANSREIALGCIDGCHV